MNPFSRHFSDDELRGMFERSGSRRELLEQTVSVCLQHPTWNEDQLIEWINSELEGEDPDAPTWDKSHPGVRDTVIEAMLHTRAELARREAATR